MKHYTPSPAAARAHAILAAWNDLTDWEARCFADFAVRELEVGPPLPAFTSMRAEAESWTAFATAAEWKIYVAAAVARMSPSDRAGLLAYLEGLAA